jgi:hypothetical protein
MTKRSDWTEGGTKEELARNTGGQTHDDRASGNDEFEVENLSNTRAVLEAQCSPSQMRHGWHPNLNYK